MSDDAKPGYDFYPPPSPVPAAPPAPGNHPYQGPMNGLLPRQTAWADSIPPVRRSGIPGWLIVLIALFLGLIGTGVLAAIAIPVFLNQRLKAEHQATAVQLPATFNGSKRNTGAKAQTVAKTFAVGELQAQDVAVYGKVGPKAVIIVALKPPTAWSEAEQSAQRNNLEQAFAAQGTPLFLIREPDPDSALGGWMGCGTTGQGLDICLATSVGSLVTVISAADGGDPVALLRQARAATVHRS